MIPVKIQCGCGQRYAFDVEPVNGHMPGAVACPVCGADGTSAAESVIAQNLAASTLVAPAPVAAAPTAVARLRPATSAPAPTTTLAKPASTSTATTTQPGPGRGRGGVLLPGQVDRTQAEHEARAKISWGDAPAAVVTYLRMQGFSQEEASSLVAALFRERAATIRANGVRKIFTGIGLMCVPIVALVVFLIIGFLPLNIFGLTLMVGVYGAWQVIKGIIMFLAPKSEPGGVGEQ